MGENKFEKEKKSLIHWFWHHPNKHILVFFFISVFLFILAAKGFFEITDSLLEEELPLFDTRIGNFIQSYRTEKLTSYMLLITHLGDRYFYIPFFVFFLFLLLLQRKNLFPFFSLLFVLITGHSINLLLKYLFERPRPQGLHLILVEEASYPSGHAMSSIIFYGYIIYLIWHVQGKILAKALITTLSITLILLISFSRVYLGVHYPSDVLAGQTVGLMWLLLIIMFLKINAFIKRNKEINRE